MNTSDSDWERSYHRCLNLLKATKFQRSRVLLQEMTSKFGKEYKLALDELGHVIQDTEEIRRLQEAGAVEVTRQFMEAVKKKQKWPIQRRFFEHIDTTGFEEAEEVYRDQGEENCIEGEAAGLQRATTGWTDKIAHNISIVLRKRRSEPPKS